MSPLSQGTYHTAAGSTLDVISRPDGCHWIEVDWLQEGGCLDCEPALTADGALVWDCPVCGGGGPVEWIPDSAAPS